MTEDATASGIADNLANTTTPAPESSTPSGPSVVPPKKSVEPTCSGIPVDQLSVFSSGVPPDHPDYESSQDTPVPDSLRELAAAFASAFSEDNPGIPSPTLGIIHSSPPPVAEPQRVALRRLSPQASTTSLTPPVEVAATQTDANQVPTLFAGITDEPAWMKKKRTLNYFRGAIKFGRLAEVIEHWYQLEALLGFPAAVSVFVWIFLQCAHNA